jgi:hypothetical protein
MATPARLTPRQRRSLTADGYLLVRSLLGGAHLARIEARLADHVRQTVATWAEDPSLDTHGGCEFTRDNGPLRVIPGSHLIGDPAWP